MCLNKKFYDFLGHGGLESLVGLVFCVGKGKRGGRDPRGIFHRRKCRLDYEFI